MVVCRCKVLRARRDVPRSEAAADVDLGTVAIADQLEAAFARGAVCRDPIADLGRAVTDRRQALVQEVDQWAVVALLEMADALAVERFVDFPHRGLSDRMAQAPGGEDRHADVLGVAAYGFGEHRSPLQAAPHPRIRRGDRPVDNDCNNYRTPPTAPPPH